MEATAAPRREAAAQHPAITMAILVAGHALKHLNNAAFFIILPEIQHGLGLSNTAVGTLSTVRSLTGSVTNLPAGFVADRFSHRWSVILGAAMITIGVAQFVMGSVNAYVLLLLAAVVASGAISFWHPPAIAALSQRFASRRGFAIAMHGTGGSIGEAAGPLIVGALLLAISWHSVMRLSIIPAVTTGVLVLVLMRNMRGQTSGGLTMGQYLRSLGLLFRNRPLLVVLVVVGGFSVVQGAVTTFLPIYLRSPQPSGLGYSPIQMAAFVSAAQVAGIVSQPVLGFLSDRYGRRQILVPSLLLLGVGSLAIGLVPAGWPLAVTVTLMGTVQFPLMALFLAAAMDIVGEQVQATTVSLVFGAGTIFGSVSPVIAGSIADASGIHNVFFFAAFVAVVAAMVLFIGARTTGGAVGTAAS